MTRRQRGFTLTELLVGISLFSIMAAAIAAFQTVLLHNQGRMMRGALLDDTATLIGIALRRRLATASHVQSPIPGAASPALTVWDNLDPADGLSPLVGAEPVRFAHFCADAAGRLFLYEGSFRPLPSFGCGADPPPGSTRMALAGDSTGRLRVSALFNRPPGESNVIQVQYQVALSADPDGRFAAVSRRTQFVLRAVKG